jgi:hypothetical protein
MIVLHVENEMNDCSGLHYLHAQSLYICNRFSNLNFFLHLQPTAEILKHRNKNKLRESSSSSRVSSHPEQSTFFPTNHQSNTMPILGLGRELKHRAIGREDGYAEGYIHGLLDGALSSRNGTRTAPTPRPPIQRTGISERRNGVEITRPVQHTNIAARRNGVEITRPVLRPSLLGLSHREQVEDIRKEFRRRKSRARETPPPPLYSQVSFEPRTKIQRRLSNGALAFSVSGVSEAPPSYRSRPSSESSERSTTSTPAARDRNTEASRAGGSNAAQGPHYRGPNRNTPYQNPRPAPRPQHPHPSTSTRRPRHSKKKDGSLRVRMISFLLLSLSVGAPKPRDFAVAMTDSSLESEGDRCNINGRRLDRDDGRYDGGDPH